MSSRGAADGAAADAPPPGDRVVIRRIGKADAAALRDIRLQALRRAPESFGASLAEESALPVARFEARIPKGPADAIFGAFDGSRIIGMTGFRVAPHAKARHRGAIWGVYVEPEWRGAGIGRRLVEAAIDHARGHVAVLQLRVVTANAPARALYEKLGFAPYGFEARALRHDGRDYDEALMKRDLDGGGAGPV